MINEENLKKILNNEHLYNIPCVILAEVVAELDLMGAFREEVWESRCNNE